MESIIRLINSFGWPLVSLIFALIFINRCAYIKKVDTVRPRASKICR